MPDITMCTNDKCPMSRKCYRYMAIPSEYSQSYLSFNPKEGYDRCDQFFPTNGYKGKLKPQKCNIE